MARVAIVLDPAGGVCEVRLLVEGDSSFRAEILFPFLKRLSPVLTALDEGLRIPSPVGPSRQDVSPDAPVDQGGRR